MSSEEQDHEVPPRGRDEVRRAVLEAARSAFARRGTRATVREIAAAAGVNPGLVHMYVGNKDDLVRAVLAVDADATPGQDPDAGTPAEVLQAMFASGQKNPEYVRMQAWLLLEDRLDLIAEHQRDRIQGLRAFGPPGTPPSPGLLLALAAVSGWSLFGDGIVDFAGLGPGQRDECEQAMADLLPRLLD